MDPRRDKDAEGHVSIKMQRGMRELHTTNICYAHAFDDSLGALQVLAQHDSEP